MREYVRPEECATARKAVEKLSSPYATVLKRAVAKDSYQAANATKRYFGDGQTNFDADLQEAVDRAFVGARTRAEEAGQLSSLVNRVRVEALEKCGLDKAYEKAADKAFEADTAVRNVLELASQVPWYPKGWIELDSGIAVKAADQVRCDWGRCVQLNVTTKQRCGTLYVEFATENNRGEKVGFTNDVLTNLDPTDRGLLTFQLQDDEAKLDSSPKVSCY
ncbi:MAG: hypothetical protein ACT4QF_09375 [Sporichthyaceae bacterium]